MQIIPSTLTRMMHLVSQHYLCFIWIRKHLYPFILSYYNTFTRSFWFRQVSFFPALPFFVRVCQLFCKCSNCVSIFVYNTRVAAINNLFEMKRICMAFPWLFVHEGWFPICECVVVSLRVWWPDTLHYLTMVLFFSCVFPVSLTHTEKRMMFCLLFFLFR